MKKVSVLLFVFFIYLSGYSQTDSSQTIKADTITKKEELPILLVKPKEKNSTSQKSSVYTLKPGVDIPIIGVGTIWSLFAFTKIYKKNSPDH
jgi:hypothetical protein